MATLLLDFRYVIPRQPARANERCRTTYDRALRAANESKFRDSCRARGAGDFCRAMEYRLCRHQIRTAQCRAADLARTPQGCGGSADGDHRRDREATMAGPDRHSPQCRRGHSGAWILSGRDRGRDRAFDPRRALGADPGSAADPDLDLGEPLARRARLAAAMGRVTARARRRGSDPARSPDERGGGLGLAGLGRVARQHHLGDAISEALLRQDRLAFRQSRAIHRGDDFLRRWRGAVREQCGALDRRVRAVAHLARSGAVDRVDRTIVLADPTLGGHLGGKPVLSGAGGNCRHGLCAVRRAARYGGDIRHGCVRGRGISGQPTRLNLTRLKSQNKSLQISSGGFCERRKAAEISASTSSPSFSSWRLSLQLSLTFWLTFSPGTSWKPFWPF